MIVLAADENFSGHILAGLLRRAPGLDIVRVQDHGPAGQSDDAVLQWAASEGRVLLTHDVSTVSIFAYERVRNGLPMPGVIEAPLKLPIGVVIEELLLLVLCSFPGELENRVVHLPL